jgi:hypothetical protein
VLALLEVIRCVVIFFLCDRSSGDIESDFGDTQDANDNDGSNVENKSSSLTDFGHTTMSASAAIAGQLAHHHDQSLSPRVTTADVLLNGMSPAVAQHHKQQQQLYQQQQHHGSQSSSSVLAAHYLSTATSTATMLQQQQQHLQPRLINVSGSSSSLSSSSASVVPQPGYGAAGCDASGGVPPTAIGFIPAVAAAAAAAAAAARHRQWRQLADGFAVVGAWSRAVSRPAGIGRHCWTLRTCRWCCIRSSPPSASPVIVAFIELRLRLPALNLSDSEQRWLPLIEVY